MRKKSTLLFMSSIVTAVFLSGCGGFSSSSSDSSGEGTKKSNKNEINLTASSEIPTMDSTKAHDMIGLPLLKNTNEGLYRNDLNNKPIPALAEKDETSNNGLVHTITLRDSKWSNGDAVTAKDFEYAWKKVMRDKSPYNYIFETLGVKNAQAIMEEKKKANDLGVKAIDDHTLKITLEHTNPLFETLLTFGTFLPQNEKFVEKMGDKYGLEADAILSNGPYKMTSWKHEQSWTLVKNDNYWDAKNVKLNKINVYVVKDAQTALNLYDAGKIDDAELTAESVDKYKDDKNFQTKLTDSIGFLRLNLDNEALKNKDIRLAVNDAIDKQSLVNIALNDGSKPLYGVVPKQYYLSPENKDFRELNGDINKGTVKQAKEEWAKGLKATGLKKVTFNLNVSDVDSSKKMAEFVQSQLETNLPGVTVNIKSVPTEQRLEVEKSIKYDLSLSTWGPDYNDPMTFLDMWVTGGSANRQHYSNKTYDALVNKAKFEPNKSERYKMLLNLENILLKEDVTVVPLYQTGSSYLLKSNIKNYPSGADSFGYKYTYVQ